MDSLGYEVSSAQECEFLTIIRNNSETWINMTKQDLDDLDNPDTMVHRGILSTEGNPSKVFMQLELGSIPMRFVIMKRRLNFLKSILNENMESMIRQVFETMKVDSRKGNFVNLVQKRYGNPRNLTLRRIYFNLYTVTMEKIPHTGDKESLNVCG